MPSGLLPDLFVYPPPDCFGGPCRRPTHPIHPSAGGSKTRPIRGWGPDCEVIEPEELRRQIAEDMRKAAEVYTRKGST